MARDPSRIDPIIEKLRAAWKTYPDQRFGQLFVNITRGLPVFYVEEDQLEQAIDAFIRGQTQSERGEPL